MSDYPYLTTPYTRTAARARAKGTLVSSSNVDEVWRLPNGEVVVVLLSGRATEGLSRRVRRKLLRWNRIRLR